MDITKLCGSLLAMMLAIIMTFSGGKNTEITNIENSTQISNENSSVVESVGGSESSESSELIISSSEISSSSQTTISSNIESSSSNAESCSYDVGDNSSSSEITEENADCLMFAGQNIIAVTVTSSDPSVVKIENGIMKAMKPGTTIITIKSGLEIIKEFSVCVSRKIIYGDDREKLYESSSSSSGKVVSKIDPFRR